MISYKKDMKTEYVTNMRGGEGTVAMTQLFDVAIPHVRLLKVIELEPNSSVGGHVHEAEAEAFYVLEGEPTVLDGGEYVTLKAGDAHLCVDGGAHSLMNRSGAKASVLAIIPTLAE